MMQAKSLLKKVVCCVVAAMSLVALLLNIFNTGANVRGFPPILIIYFSVVLITGSLIYSFVWHYRKEDKIITTQKNFQVLYSIIRYSIAFNVSFFGWAKLLEIQFRVPESISSQPMNRQSGEWLTWYYFGYSYGFSLILAVVQIAGAILILFRKTVLLGATILFSLMFNITLINIFYRMNYGALFMSILITIGTMFLFMSDYKRLVEFFLKSNSSLPSLPGGNNLIKHIFWFSAILLSFLFVLYLKSSIKL